jgi:2',3'-cyclic-nucleotide 2'-phosphodiesterase (5'-nucleotidase family)
MRVCHIFLGVLALLAMAATPVFAADPVLTIVFAGNTYGYFDPCPTCGPQKLGGLARRATYIDKLRKNPPTAGKTLAVAGAWEFLPEVAATPPEPDKIPAVAKAHERLAYDALVISPAEAKLLADHKAAPPKGAILLDQAPSTRIVPIGGQSVGLVFFPMPKDLSAPVPDKLMETTAKAAAELRGKVALVIGISPWGALDEEAFINTRSGAVDVLLGSGGGSGFSSRTSKDGKTLWTRAYIKGKTVNRLELNALPSPAASAFTWKLGENFAARVDPLDEAYPQDAAIEQLF